MMRATTKVLFDAHQLGRRQTGNETYVRELIRALRHHDELTLIAAVEAGQSATEVLAPPIRLRRIPSNGLARLASLAIAARIDDADVVHAIYFLPPATGRPTVLTVHDISFERYPEFFSRRALIRDRVLIRASARMASRVITVSEASRRDIIETYRLPEDRVVAIPNGVGSLFRPDSASTWEPFNGRRALRVLAVGTLQPRKNLLRLLDALGIVGRDVPIHLRVVGPDGHQAIRIRERLASSVNTEIVGWIDDDALAAEYRRADVFVYPSIYEGFGLPVIEAMACGTPTVTSTGGSLPEVAGDAALIVDPEDITALVGAIRQIAMGGDEVVGLRRRGFARAAAFTWERSASLHAAVYADLVAQ